MVMILDYDAALAQANHSERVDDDGGTLLSIGYSETLTSSSISVAIAAGFVRRILGSCSNVVTLVCYLLHALS